MFDQDFIQDIINEAFEAEKTPGGEVDIKQNKEQIENNENPAGQIREGKGDIFSDEKLKKDISDETIDMPRMDSDEEFMTVMFNYLLRLNKKVKDLERRQG